MGKKTLNPAEAYRKAQRKKELKKNKADRSKARDFSLVKKDTTDLELAIKELEESRADSDKLAELKAELEKINRKKAEYVEEHPEQRGLVYRRRKQGEPEPELPIKKKRNLFNKNGLPRHPERSIYYDPVMNPFGVAPPGMPYVERPLRPDEVDSEAETDEDDDDIPLPPGLPPGTEEVTSDDDIPMPDDLPPGKEIETVNGLPPMTAPPLPGILGVPLPPPPPGFPPNGLETSFIPPPPPPPGPPVAGIAPAQLPSGWNSQIPPPPPGWTGQPLPPPPAGFYNQVPPPPPPPGFPSYPSISYPPFPPNAFPPPPPNFLLRQQSTSSMQDPLSSVPHTTYQGHRASQLAPPHPSLPVNPSVASFPTNPLLPVKPTAAAEMAAATVYSAPQLRDLKKEATAFVPSVVKRKKAITSSKIDAAPALTSAAPQVDGEEQTSARAARPDLVSALKSQFGPAPSKVVKEQPAQKSDYEKFMEEMSDILGTK